MIAPSVVEQLEAERAAVVQQLGRIDTALEALRGNRAGPAPRGVRLGRPVKKAPPRPVTKITRGRGQQSTKHLDGKRTGRAPAWDVVQAERLWKSRPDMTADEIGDRVGTTGANLGERARRLGWGARPKKATAGSRKCKGCGSTIGADRDTCPSCGIPA